MPATAVVAFFCYLWFVSGVVPHEEHYPTGELKSVGYVKRQGWQSYLRHGRWVTYHKNGVKASEGFYRAGQKAGDWRYWDEAGQPLPTEPRSDNGER